LQPLDSTGPKFLIQMAHKHMFLSHRNRSKAR